MAQIEVKVQLDLREGNPVACLLGCELLRGFLRAGSILAE